MADLLVKLYELPPLAPVLDELKEKNIIQREGSTKKGTWIILK